MRTRNLAGLMGMFAIAGGLTAQQPPQKTEGARDLFYFGATKGTAAADSEDVHAENAETRDAEHNRPQPTEGPRQRRALPWQPPRPPTWASGIP